MSFKAVDAVFEKALSEPTFSPVYAEFCEKLSAALPAITDDASGKVALPPPPYAKTMFISPRNSKACC